MMYFSNNFVEYLLLDPSASGPQIVQRGLKKFH